jgi:hypothetical protein
MAGPKETKIWPASTRNKNPSRRLKTHAGLSRKTIPGARTQKSSGINSFGGQNPSRKSSPVLRPEAREEEQIGKKLCARTEDWASETWQRQRNR